MFYIYTNTFGFLEMLIRKVKKNYVKSYIRLFRPTYMKKVHMQINGSLVH